MIKFIYKYIKYQKIPKYYAEVRRSAAGHIRMVFGLPAYFVITGGSELSATKISISIGIKLYKILSNFLIDNNCVHNLINLIFSCEEYHMSTWELKFLKRTTATSFLNYIYRSFILSLSICI
jgi:hypothetical protein